MVGPFAGWTVWLERQGHAAIYLGWLLRSLGASVRAPDGRWYQPAGLAEYLASDVQEPAECTVIIASPSEAARYLVRFYGIAEVPDWRGAGDPAAWAWGGMASLTGQPDGPPLAPGAPVAAMCGALHALIALAAARHARLSSMEVTIGLADVVASLIEVAGLQYAADGTVRGRAGDWWGRAGWGLYPCADGTVAVAIRDREQLLRLAQFLNEPELTAERYADFAWGLCQALDEVNGILVRGLAARRVRDVVVGLRARRIAVAEVPDLAGLLTSEHLLVRNAFEQVNGLRLPRLPIRGLQDVPADEPPYSGAAQPTTRPLMGTKVLDISSVWAGPMAARLLADLGAEVVKVERPKKRVGSYSTGATWDRDFYAILNDRNKQAFSCDFRDQLAHRAFVELVRKADVLVENFAPGSLDRLGLGHRQLHAINPRLVVVSMPAMGLWGPDSETVGYGSTIEQAAGLGWLYADEAGAPHRSGVNFSDPIAGLFAAAGAILALGGDRHEVVVEVSQQEAALALMLGVLAAYQRTGRHPTAIAARWTPRGWGFGLAAGREGGLVPVRSVAEVVGGVTSPGSRAIRWVHHPDGRWYPLVCLPWDGSFSAAVEPVPAEMPRPLGA